MEPLSIEPHLVIPGDALSVSYTRDMGGDSGPESARRVPTTVELRFEAGRCESLDEEQLERILEHPQLRHNRRGTVRVVCGHHATRRANLREAREMLATRVREALEGRVPVDEDEPPPRRGGQRGLIKRPGRRRTG